MGLRELHVVDRQTGGLCVHAEDVVPLVAEIADADRETPRIGPRGSEQNGLFRAPAGTANASKLQNANRSCHEAAVAVRGRTARCGARDTRATARATSNTDATMKTASMPTARRGRARNAARITRRHVAAEKLNRDAPMSRRPNDAVTKAATTPATP